MSGPVEVAPAPVADDPGDLRPIGGAWAGILRRSGLACTMLGVIIAVARPLSASIAAASWSTGGIMLIPIGALLLLVGWILAAPRRMPRSVPGTRP